MKLDLSSALKASVTIERARCPNCGGIGRAIPLHGGKIAALECDAGHVFMAPKVQS